MWRVDLEDWKDLVDWRPCGDGSVSDTGRKECSGDRNGDGRRLEAQAKMMEARGKQWGNAIRWWVLLGIRNGAR